MTKYYIKLVHLFINPNSNHISNVDDVANDIWIYSDIDKE